jgi:autotransporter-associated beta strand protein
MKLTRIPPVYRMLVIPLLISGSAFAVTPITITNPGFELPVVEEGLYEQAPTGWSAYNGAVLGSTVYAYNPSIDDFATEAPEGSNVAGVLTLLANGVEKGLSQTLSTTFKEGDAYQLTVKVGYSNYFAVNPGYKIQLLAGGTVIAEDDNSLSPAFGQFVTSTLNYVYDPADSGLVNQALQIRLINKGLDDIQNEVAFDDVQLSVVLANPEVNAGGPYYLPNSTTSLSLVATALPSGNETITAYEWDLDNDGQFDDATGATPAAISYTNLQTLFGMIDGSNTVRVRVTDSSSKTAIDDATVQLVNSTKYTGPASNNDTWNTATNWDNGIPQGDLDVVILASKSPLPWSNATPTYTGNLTLQNNAALSIGWTTQLLGSYNALGTPGLTKIFMNPGSSIITRMGGTAIVPEIQLLGNALFGLGSSTQGGATLQFNYPISGSNQLQLQGNGQASCIANFNVPNSFGSLYAFGAPYVDPGLTIRANSAGSLGSGNITIAKHRTSTTSYAILEINAANAMADTATLSISGTTGTMLRMNANDTIAAFVFNGVTQPAGTYGSTTSSATYKFSWITGTGILTVGTPAVGYWDLNGVTAGAGGITPSGIWNSSNTYWNSSTDGTGSAAAWTAGNTAIFAAGSDTTGSYTVDVVGNQDMSGLIMRNGSIALAQGSGGNLRLTANGSISVSSGSSSIATPISQDASTRSLTVSNAGTLTLSGDLSHSGGTTLVGGTLILSGNNSLAIGATTVNAGALFVNAANSIPGSTRNLTINSSGTLAFGPSFGSENIQTALNNRIVTTSAGTIVANHFSSTSVDFNTAGLSAAYFGSLGDVSYTGTLTPHGTAYRLSGEGGTLTMANTNAITGARSLTVRGYVTLAANNDFTGATTVLANASLSLPGTTATSGITLNAGSILTIGNSGSLGTGTLTFAGLSTLNTIGTLVTTNPIAANADFITRGSGSLTLGAITINNNRNITAEIDTTISSISRDGANNRSLSIGGSRMTTVTGSLTLGVADLTKNDSGTLILNGTNNYRHMTINGGILRLNGSVSGAGATYIAAAGLQLGNASNGGLPIGNIIINSPSAYIQAVDADRSISNNLILENNLTISGSQSLTIGGKLTNSSLNRTLTNNIISTKSLTLGDVDLSNNTTSRVLTIASSGKTVINGIIANGGGSTAGALIKSGSGQLILNGNNTYAGTTTVNANSGDLLINGSMGATNITVSGGSNLYVNGSTGAGSITMNGTSKLYVNGSTGSGNITINNGATLLGTGTIGGNTTIAAGGKLVFSMNSMPAAHDKLELGAGRTLTFSGSSQVTVSGFVNTGSYTLLTAPGGIVGTVPSLVYPDGWIAGLSIVGNDLVLTVEYSGVFPDPPTLVSIADDKSGGPVDVYTPITYTVTFNEDMNDTTVSTADFSNSGTASVVFGNIVETAPGVFTLQVTPTTAGTLQLRINAGASLQSAAGLNLNTTNALLDNNTLDITVPVHGVLAVTTGDYSAIGDPGGPFSPSSKTYTLNNYGSQSLDWTAAKSVAWLNLSSTSGTLAPGTSTTVTVSPNASANALSIGAYYDTITFANTTAGAGNGLGNTTRGVSLTVNGLPVDVTLGNLYQTYDGTPKAVTVTTSPEKTYSLTYNGLSGAGNIPTDAGSYEVVATVTESGYTGSASGTLLISKASQSINFAALGTVGNDQTSITLTATSTSNLPVTFTSSNSEVATVDGNTVTIVGVGTSTITAIQAGDENYHPADSVEQVLTVIRANPLAVPGGPYTVSSTADLSLNGSGSLASDGQTISTYEWDLDDSNDGAGFSANVTGAAPAAINMTTLQSTYGMVVGNNPIRLRVTDSAGKISIQSTTVLLTAPLRWDADANYANGQNDGSGGWLSLKQWRDVAAGSNIDWISGKDAIFGNGGTGGSVPLFEPTTVGSITVNAFSGTYDLGNVAGNLTINRGITVNAGSGNINLNSPIILGGSQTWTNNSSGTVTVPGLLDLGSNTLTIDNVGQVTIPGANVGASATGTGGIIKNGTGLLRFANGGAPVYTGPTVINAGRLMIGNGGALPPGNLTLNNAILQAYYTFSVTRTLGPGAGQVQLTGGTTGFSSMTSMGASVTLNNSANYEVVWGSQYFSPSTFVMENGPDTLRDLSFNNKIDLNGATRTVSTPLGAGVTTLGSTATFYGIIRNSSATPAGLIKTGSGILRLNAANSYNGGTTLQEGTLQLGNLTGLGSSVGTLSVNGGLLNLNNIAAVTVGNLTGTGGTIANNGAGAITFTIGNGNATGGNFQGVIANNTNAGTGTLALTKTGTGSITLSGANTYTGATTINQGKLFINGSTAASNITVASGATLGGSGTLGGNATIAANGKLEFNINTPAGSHNPLDFGSGKGLTFSGASELTISMSVGAAPGTYVLVTGGNNITGIAPATLRLPFGCIANVSIVGNELRLVVTDTGDITPPTLAANSIVDDKSGNQVTDNTLVTYTVTFSEDMDAATVGADDFSNAGTASANIGTVTETSPGVFSVPVTPTSIGTLQLKVNASAVLTDVAGNALNTASAIVDDTTISVISSDTTPPTLANTDIVDNKSGGPVMVNTLVTYTVTFSEDMDAATVSAADFGNAGTASFSIGTVTETSPGVFSVPVTPSSAGTLQLKVNASAVLTDLAGNALNTASAIVDDTTITVDDTLPTLASSAIVDNKSGGPVMVNTLVTYTVTFSEDMDAATVSAADFGNAGTASASIGTVTETSPGVFSVPVTPSTAGTLQLKVNASAVLTDVAGNALNTASAIVDDTTITVQRAFEYWSAGAASSADANNDGVSNAMAWLLGAANISTNAISLMPTHDNTSDATYFIYTYRRSDMANLSPGTVITVEYATNLSSWNTASHNGTNIVISETDDFYGVGVDRVQVKIARSLATNGKLFTRLKLVP